MSVTPKTPFPKLAAPALRALAAAGYTHLEQLAGVSEAELAKLHGMGPNALAKLEYALAQIGLNFENSTDLIKEICPEIRNILEREIEDRNAIHGIARSTWPKNGSLIVSMKRIFKGKPGTPSHEYARDIFVPFDFHWMGDSYFCTKHNCIIIAPIPRLDETR